MRCARAKSQKSQNRRHAAREVPSRSFGAASGAPCGLVGGSVSHQRSPLVLQGCQRAKRPCSCPNKTLGYRLQSVLGARSAPSEKVRFSSSISKILKSSWLLRGQIPKLVLKPAKEPEAQNPQKSAVLRILGVGYDVHPPQLLAARTRYALS